ncbi:MAG: hypothetical protein ACJA1A_001941 [Saprospiraceae bacterium]|jgi:hypothetical protein
MYVKDYVEFNRVVIIVIFVIVCIAGFLVESDSFICMHKAITGYECKSCGVTRDFINYLKLDFSKNINQYSFNLFLFCMLQFGYRLAMSTYGLIIVDKVDIKKVIIVDVMITFLFTTIVFYPFWI